MNHSLRSAARFAAVSALCLALPAAAQTERAAEIVGSPFGPFHSGWSAALSGAMLQPSGPLNAYAFPPSVSYDEKAAFAPDEAVLHRLAPVAVALERGGVAPSEFARLSPLEQAAKVKAILPESNKLVAEFAEKILADDAAGHKRHDLFRSYYTYLDEGALAAAIGAYDDALAIRHRRIAEEAIRSAAKDLNDRAAASNESSPQPVARPAEPRREDARLAEIRMLLGQLGKSDLGALTGSEVRTDAAMRAFQLATTGEPNEAVQKAAVRLLITSAERESRTKFAPKVDEVLARIDQIGRLAEKSPYVNVQRLAINNLLDNALEPSYADYRIQPAAIEAVRRTAGVSQRQVKEETLSLLLREFETRSNPYVKQEARAAIDGIKAGMSYEPQVAKAPRKLAASHGDNRAPVAGAVGAGVAGALTAGYALTLTTLNPIAVVVSIALMVACLIGFMIALKEVPWYRMDE